MRKIIPILLSIFFIPSIVLGQPSKNETNLDWPCIQVLIKELSWGSIWTGPPLDEDSSKWRNNDQLRSFSQKLMIRKTKQEDGIKELKRYIKKNSSLKDSKLLFHALFDTTNEIWKKRVEKLLQFGKRQRKNAKEISDKLVKIKKLSDNPEPNKEELKELEEERFWDVRRFEDRRALSDALCEQPRYYEKRLGVYTNIILENLDL